VDKAKRLYHTITDLTGQKFGRLKVLGYSPSVKHQLSRWVVLCDCGKKHTIYGHSLIIKNKTTIAKITGVGRTTVNRVLKNCV